MRLSLLLSVSLLLAGQAAHAQSADDYFNGGAQAYISNNIPQALGAVQAGLKQYPDDAKLKKLYALLKQQQQSQNNQSQPNQQQSQSQQSSSQQNQQPQNQQPSQTNSQPQKQNEQKPSDQKNNGQPNQPQPQKSDEPQGGGQPENQNGQGQPPAAGQMTPAEARRMLDAQKGDEQFLQLKPQGKPQNNRQSIKDW
jgi:acyl-CoA-binding protein